MKTQTVRLSSVLGKTGILLCLLATLVRFFGYHYIGGFETLSFFIGGTALVVIANWVKLHQA